MKKILLMVVLLVGFAGFVVLGDDAKAGKASNQEQQFKAGDTGTLTGTIGKIEKGKVTVKDGDKSTTVWPKFVNGAPDKEIMAEVEKLKVGDKVKVEWVADKEHQRIKSIDKVE